MLLACLHCKEWDRRQQVRRVDDQPECPSCGSIRVAAPNPWADEKDDDQQTQTERAYRAASLVQSHGTTAVVALATRGVGPRHAASINNPRENEEEFYRDILERERNYARTKSVRD